MAVLSGPTKSMIAAFSTCDASETNVLHLFTGLLEDTHKE
jgi:hypothetical protein